ncbi:hypothetical protein [Desulfonema magnum]|uniref:Uncharacterized protein n=1 Tax=Desulfonema magnum TaxID=45655 RepID=A0A975BVT1_9BACT|nr:hypothetical protein [Desulfonema magnum]QTA92139.1 Uncharacterized protein dnm_082150 [Desulfonema magnum]
MKRKRNYMKKYLIGTVTLILISCSLVMGATFHVPGGDILNSPVGLIPLNLGNGNGDGFSIHSELLLLGFGLVGLSGFMRRLKKVRKEQAE